MNEITTKLDCSICKNPKSDGGGSLTQWLLMCGCDGEPLTESALGLSLGICYQCGKGTRPGSCGSISQFIFQRELCTCNAPESVSALLNGPNLAECKQVLSVDEHELELSPYLFPVHRFKPLSQVEVCSEGASYLARDRVLDSIVMVSVAHTLDEEYARSFLERAKELCKLENESSEPKLLNAGVTIAAIPYIVTQVCFEESLDDEEENETEEEECSGFEKADSTPFRNSHLRLWGFKLCAILAVAFAIAAVMSLVAIWAKSVLTVQGVDHIAAPVKTEDPEENLSSSLSLYESNKWTRMTLNGGTIYDAGPANTDEDFAHLARFDDVSSLRVLCSDTITGTGLAHLSKFPLTSIQLDSTRLSDDGLGVLATFSTMRFVGLGWGEHITDDGLRRLTKLTNLEFLALDHLRLPKNTMSIVASMPSLIEIRIAVPDRFDPKQISRLAVLERLKSLSLCTSGLTDDDCSSLLKLPHVSELILVNNEITDRGVEQLAQMPLLKLDLSGNNITDSSLEVLSKVPTLKELTVIDCSRITENGKIAFLNAKPKCWLADRRDVEKRRGPQ